MWRISRLATRDGQRRTIPNPASGYDLPFPLDWYTRLSDGTLVPATGRHRYRRTDTSGLSVEVTVDGKNDFTFDLEGEKLQ